jgi:hypothetical protein
MNKAVVEYCNVTSCIWNSAHDMDDGTRNCERHQIFISSDGICSQSGGAQ